MRFVNYCHLFFRQNEAKTVITIAGVKQDVPVLIFTLCYCHIINITFGRDDGTYRNLVGP